MAGHSKWANIKHKKERSDAQKGKLFSRIAKEIISSVKIGGPDPKNNPRLRLAITQAKAANMPSENIERNIKKASSTDQADYFPVTYEMYGYGGVGILIEGMTDNRNRFASDMRIATNKKGGTIANPGAVSFNFERKGVIQVKKESVDEGRAFEVALEAGALDFEVADDIYMITTEPTALFEVKERLDVAGIGSCEVAIEWIPTTLMACEGEARSNNQALIAFLEELEDVNAVYHNMEL